MSSMSCRYVLNGHGEDGIEEDGWSTVASMSKIRGRLASSRIGGTFYAIGGGIPSEQYSLVEGWALIIPMPLVQQRMPNMCLNVLMCTLELSNPLCLLCDLVLCDRYDPITDRWRVFPHGLQTPRFALASTVVKGSTVCVGGLHGTQYLDTVESFDPREGRCSCLLLALRLPSWNFGRVAGSVSQLLQDYVLHFS